MADWQRAQIWKSYLIRVIETRAYFTELRNNNCLHSKPYLDISVLILSNTIFDQLLTKNLAEVFKQSKIKQQKSLPVLGRGRRLEWCCQACWEAQRCCSCTCSTIWSPSHQECWTASSSPFLSYLQQSVNIWKRKRKRQVNIMRLKAEIASSLPKPHFHCTNFSRTWNLLWKFLRISPKKTCHSGYVGLNIQELWTSGFVVPNKKCRSQCCIVARKHDMWHFHIHKQTNFPNLHGCWSFKFLEK